MRHLNVVMPTGFLAILLAQFLAPELVLVLLGEAFASAAPVLKILLAGTYLAIFGFMLVPFQRASARYIQPTKLYWLAASLAVTAAFTIIPHWPIYGAMCTFLIAKSADILTTTAVIRFPDFPQSERIRLRIYLCGFPVLLFTGAL